MSNGDVHRISRAAFDQLCAGAVTPDVVALLRRVQYSRRRLLLVALVDAVSSRFDVTGPLGSAEPAWRVLADADEAAPEVVEDVLMTPSAGTWLVRALGRLHRDDDVDPPLWTELGWLNALAAAVAIRAGLPCELVVPVVRGVVTWPTVGQVRFDEVATGVATASVTPAGVDLRGGPFDLPAALRSPWYAPAHRHETGDRRLAVELDDRTPYRLFGAPEDPRPLDRTELVDWWARLDEAWRLLTRWHPGFAGELSAGLTTLVPIPRPTRVVGSSSPAAFGAVAMSEPASPADLAAVLVHEFQHSKLNAVLDLVVLHTRPADELGYAPWRDDPRPLTGVLHGIYAFTSNVEFWYAQSRGNGTRAALFAFAQRHLQVRAAVEALAEAGDLTELGRELVDAAARRLSACPLDDVPADLLALLETTAEDHRATWRVRHVRPDERRVQDLVLAWRAGAPAPRRRSGSPAIEPERRTARQLRTRLTELMATAPDRFPADPEPGIAGDVAFVAGRLDEAREAYVHRLRATPGDGDAWVGLGLTLRAAGEEETARAVLAEPEVVPALYPQVRSASDSVPDPVRFARWLSR